MSDYDYASALATKHLSSWVDGRVSINGVYQQDAFTDREVVGPMPTPTATPTPTPTPTSTPGQITLGATGYKVRGVDTVDLTWTGATSSNIDVYRNGVLIATALNTGAYTDSTGQKGRATFTYRVCEVGTQNCSNQVTVRFGGGGHP